MQLIRLSCFGIEVALDGKGAGTIKSDLIDDADLENPKDAVDVTEYTAAVNAIESLILAHACAGIDISSLAYIEGIETAVDKVLNEY
jgi:hypothetical protein